MNRCIIIFVLLFGIAAASILTYSGESEKMATDINTEMTQLEEQIATSKEEYVVDPSDIYTVEPKTEGGALGLLTEQEET